MIKALLRESGGQAIVVLGLSGENMARLMANEPIVVQVAELGLKPMKILLMGGRTEEAITTQLTEQFGQARKTIHQEPGR
jgi:hypothetical protein